MNKSRTLEALKSAFDGRESIQDDIVMIKHFFRNSIAMIMTHGIRFSFGMLADIYQLDPLPVSARMRETMRRSDADAVRRRITIKVPYEYQSDVDKRYISHELIEICGHYVNMQVASAFAHNLICLCFDECEAMFLIGLLFDMIWYNAFKMIETINTCSNDDRGAFEEFVHICGRMMPEIISVTRLADVLHDMIKNIASCVDPLHSTTDRDDVAAIRDEISKKCNVRLSRHYVPFNLFCVLEKQFEKLVIYLIHFGEHKCSGHAMDFASHLLKKSHFCKSIGHARINLKYWIVVFIEERYKYEHRITMAKCAEILAGKSPASLSCVGGITTQNEK